jgi:sugar lactone lactonase YvrE
MRVGRGLGFAPLARCGTLGGVFARRTVSTTAGSAELVPDPAGKLMPDGSRWGTFSPSQVRFDDAHSIFASTELEIVASGVRWSEGPVWVAEERALYFDSPIEAKIYRWREGEGASVIVTESGGFDGSNVENYDTLFEPGANGMALAGDEMIVCQHPTRRVIRISRGALAQLGGAALCTASYEIVAEAAANGRRLNAPNDVIVARNGDIFFTDPVYGFLQKQPEQLGYAYLNAEAGEPPDQPYLDEMVAAEGAGLTGVYRVRDGVVSLVTDALTRPNGLALSPDEETLWVANKHRTFTRPMFTRPTFTRHMFTPSHLLRAHLIYSHLLNSHVLCSSLLPSHVLCLSLCTGGWPTRTRTSRRGTPSA